MGSNSVKDQVRDKQQMFTWVSMQVSSVYLDDDTIQHKQTVPVRPLAVLTEQSKTTVI